MSGKSAKVFQAGIIDIGSHSVRLDIFEVAPGGEPVLLESLSRPVNLGYDVFRKGAVSSENISLLSEVMCGFARKLSEYGAAARCRVVATSAMREAFNRELVINRVRNDSGLTIEILETQEEARITFLAVREELRKSCDFDKLSGIAFIVGTGSLIVIFFEGGLLRFCEAVPLGTVRFFDEFGRSAVNAEEIIEILYSSAIEQRIRDCVRLRSELPLSLVGIGAGVRLLVRQEKYNQPHDVIRLPVAEVSKLAGQAMRTDPEKLARKLNIPDHLALSLAPCGSLVTYFLKEFTCGELINPATTTRSALIYDLIRKVGNIHNDPFHDDIIAAAEGIGRKYGIELGHARSVTCTALKIFDKLKRFYDFPPRGRLLLEVAGVLHDVGRFVDTRQHHKHSYYLIVNAQIPGLTVAEQQIVATVARYHRKAGPKSSHPEYISLSSEEKVLVLKLAAILRVADALDRAHFHRMRDMTLRLRGDEFFILVAEAAQFNLESLYLEAKGDMFREVFGLKIRLGDVLEGR
ncbi:MAG: HD domain-containing protein [Victivallaceae bacterium]